MSDLNVVVLMGRLGRDPEMRATQSGTPVCEISLAVNVGFGDRKSTAWVKVVSWGKTAEFVDKYFKKGGPICITGRLEEEKWKDKESGKERTRLFVTAEKASFSLSSKSENAETQEVERPRDAQVQSTLSGTLGDDDIPF